MVDPIDELKAMGAVWIDRDGNDVVTCDHDMVIRPLPSGGSPMVHCEKCLKTAEDIIKERRKS